MRTKKLNALEKINSKEVKTIELEVKKIDENETHYNYIHFDPNTNQIIKHKEVITCFLVGIGEVDTREKHKIDLFQVGEENNLISIKLINEDELKDINHSEWFNDEEMKAIEELLKNNVKLN